MISDLRHRLRMRRLTRQMARNEARRRHPASQHPSPRQIERASEMTHAMAGVLVHFAATPGVFPQFIDYLRAEESLVRADVTEETIRRMLKATHDMLAPGCPEPIEAA